MFAAWTNPDHLARWWGPAGFHASSCTVRLEEGGRWRTCITDGTAEHWASGVYQEIVPPERLVFSFSWEEPAGTREHDTLVTVTFSDRDGKTEMTFHQAIFRTVAERDSHVGGWQECFTDLAAHLKESTA
ncbi:SRPBCC domain-containing protein [Actinophytocola sp. KF-1]